MRILPSQVGIYSQGIALGGQQIESCFLLDRLDRSLAEGRLGWLGITWEVVGVDEFDQVSREIRYQGWGFFPSNRKILVKTGLSWGLHPGQGPAEKRARRSLTKALSRRVFTRPQIYQATL